METEIKEPQEPTIQEEITPDMIKAFTVPEGQEVTVSTIIDPNKEQQPTQQTQKPELSQTDYKPNSLWDIAKQKLELQDLPEPIKSGKFDDGKTDYDYLEEAILNKHKPQQKDLDYDNIPEVAKEIIEKHKTGTFDEKEYFRQRNLKEQFFGLQGEAFWKQHFLNKGVLKTDANPDGLTEEEINELVKEKVSSKYSKIEEKDLKESYKQAFKSHEIEQENINKQKYSEQLKEIDTKRDKIFNDLFKKAENMKDIYGIPIGKAERDTHNLKFKAALTQSDENPLVNLKVPKQVADTLNSDEVLYRLFYMIEKGEPEIKKILFRQGANAKQDVLNKLDLKPQIKEGGQDDVSLHSIDVTAFSKPE
jgi:hypothetical protein